MANLKRLIVAYNYPVEFQKTILRDKFVCVLANESTRKRLLTEENKLTFEQAIAIGVHGEGQNNDDKVPVVHQVSCSSQQLIQVVKSNSPQPATDMEEPIL